MPVMLGALSCEAFDAGDRMEGSLPMDELFLRLAAEFSVFTEESSLESSRSLIILIAQIRTLSPGGESRQEIIF